MGRAIGPAVLTCSNTLDGLQDGAPPEEKKMCTLTQSVDVNVLICSSTGACQSVDVKVLMSKC